MRDTPDLPRHLEAALDREQALALFKGAIGCASITGAEAHFVAFLETAMRLRGIDPIDSAEFSPGRPNIWGERKGQGGGPRLLFVGHTDTVHADGWREHWAGTERADPFGAAIVDGQVWGRGAGDLKAGICASLAALTLLDAAGIRLKGDLAYAFVGDEESGQPGSGVSAGIKQYTNLVQSGAVARPDFTIYVEPTRLSVYPAQMGFFIADITITGRSAYFGVPELGRDALKAAHTLLSALWAHSDTIAARSTHDLVGRAFLLVTELRAGGLIAVPGACSLSLIRKLLPGESLDLAVAELEAVIATAINDPDINVTCAYPAGRDHPLGGSPAEIGRETPEIEMLSRAMAQAMAGRGAIEGAPYWSESPFFINEIGCPAVYSAPGDIRNCHTLEERVSIDEYLAGIVAFALFIASYCGVAD